MRVYAVVLLSVILVKTNDAHFVQEAALRIVRELAKGPRSRWAAYLACLPHDVHNIDTADPQLWHNTPWVCVLISAQCIMGFVVCVHG